MRFTNIHLVYSRRTSSFIFDWYGPFNIVKIEALDQSEGLGGIVTNYTGGVNHSMISLRIEGVLANYDNDFIINVYVENKPNNDFLQGDLTQNSILLHT